MKANASKRRAMSYGRMEKRAAHLRKEVDRLLVQAGKADDKEDPAYGKGKRSDELPEDLRFKEKTGKRIFRQTISSSVCRFPDTLPGMGNPLEMIFVMVRGPTVVRRPSLS